MPSLSALLQLADRKSPGPAPSFEAAHLLLVFLTIGESGLMGRGSLAARSGLGAGAIRTILRKLRDAGLADANPSGCFVTPEGKKVFNALSTKMSGEAVVARTDLTIGAVQVALAVRRRGSAVRGGIEQRDSAIRVGASGATTFVYVGGRFSIPGGSRDCELDFPSKSWGELRSKLEPHEDDAVVLCGASSEPLARVGALSAALTLF